MTDARVSPREAPVAARATVGRSSDLDRLIAVVMTRAGVRTCLACGGDDTIEHFVSVGQTGEHDLIGAGRQRYTAPQHGVEEARVHTV